MTTSELVHDHEHGEGCGHVAAMPHGDHVDYLHETAARRP
jgi:hypothetical protein